MRHPVSTGRESSDGLELLQGSMPFGLVGLLVAPGAPEDAQPGASEDADGVGMVAAASPSALVDGRGPGRGVARVVGEAGECASQAMVAGPAEEDTECFAALVGDRRDTGFGGDQRSR